MQNRPHSEQNPPTRVTGIRQAAFYLLSNPANAAHLLGSIQQAKAGNVTERELIEE